MTQAPDIFEFQGMQFKVEAVVEAHVTHHAPCVPECSECYPCKRCGLVHALGLHDGEGDQ